MASAISDYSAPTSEMGYGNLTREGQPRLSSEIEDINKRDNQTSHNGCYIVQFKHCVAGRAGMFVKGCSL